MRGGFTLTTQWSSVMRRALCSSQRGAELAEGSPDVASVVRGVERSIR